MLRPKELEDLDAELRRDFTPKCPWGELFPLPLLAVERHARGSIRRYTGGEILGLRLRGSSTVRCARATVSQVTEAVLLLDLGL